MPVVSVLALRPDDEGAVRRTLAGVVAAVAAALDAPPSGTWAHFLAADAVQQGERAVGFAGHCPVVLVRGQRRDPVDVAAVLEAVAAAVSVGLGVPVEDVWVQWIEVLPGRVFAGGEVLS